MNLLDFIIFLVVAIFLVSRRRLSFLYYLIIFLISIIGYLAGTKLSVFVSKYIETDFSKGVISIVLIYGLAILGYVIGSRIGNIIRIKLLESDKWKFDRIFGLPAKLFIVLTFVFLQSQTLPYIPILGLQFMVQGSTFLHNANKISPNNKLSKATSEISPDQFNKLILDYDSNSPSLDTIGDVGEFNTAIKRIAPSVVKITGRDCVGLGFGSGFIIAPNLVVTNAHVVTGSSTIYISDIYGSYPATPQVINKDYDIAILYSRYIKGKPIAVADRATEYGDDIAVIGYPGGGDLRVDTGVKEKRIHNLSFLNLKLPEDGALYFDAQSAKGNSGGPIVNKSGEVVAVVSGGGDGSTVGININLVKELVNKAENKVVPGRAGFCDTKIKRL